MAKSKSAPHNFNGKLTVGDHDFDSTDLLLIAMLRDGVLAPEFCFSDPNNIEYGGCYRVRDYQVAFNRVEDNYAVFACARSVGKTEREIIRGFIHYFRRAGENLLITAPELLHLLPLTDKIEERIENCRLTRECLKRERAGETGFGHNPFHANFADGTKIVARIPNRDGRGVKGQHQRDLIIEEGQDYPDEGYTEVHETVMKDGDFTYHIYGVHRGARGGGFAKRVGGMGFKLHCLTAMQRPSWDANEKQAAIDTYGGTNSPDYRRNILGEPGAAASPIFVVSRLMACIDQNLDSEYNTMQYVKQHFRWEDFAGSGLPLDDLLDLPANIKSNKIIAGADLGLTNSPTVFSIFAEIDHKAHGEKFSCKRLALIRRITLERFPAPEIRRLAHSIWKWNPSIIGIGMDTTGLGFPIFQEIEESDEYSDEFKSKVRGWKFNEKIEFIEPGEAPETHDPYGNPLPWVEPPEPKVTALTVIEATTQYLRAWVDSRYILLPFDHEVSEDLLAENMQRVNDLSRLTGSRKPNRFHILDSFRMASLIDKIHSDEFEQPSDYVPPLLDGFIDV